MYLFNLTYRCKLLNVSLLTSHLKITINKKIIYFDMYNVPVTTICLMYTENWKYYLNIY